MAGGSYDEDVAPTNSGTLGNLITYIAGTGTRPKVRRFNLTGKSYITINGLEFTNTGFSADTLPSITVTNTTGVQILNNYIHDTTTITSTIRGQTPIATSLKISGNILTNIGPPGNRQLSMEIQGNEILVENNDISHVNDYTRLFGSRNVLRNNILHDSYVADTSPSAHIDGIQGFCADGVSWDYLLVEGNTYRDNPDSNSHFGLINGLVSGGCTSTSVVLRYNTLYRVGDAAYGDGDAPGAATHHKFYNNTMVIGAIGTPEHATLVMNGISSSTVLNNIFVDAISNSAPYQMYTKDSMSGFIGDYNLAYMTTGSVMWDAANIGAETHGVRNLNPLFAAPIDFNLTSTSPAVQAGGPLTTVAVADTGTGTTLVVTDAHLFQDGWAGVAKDYISVGTVANAMQIASINYSTNTITLAGSISRMDGDPVWLQRNSNGAQVLYGSAADIGAYPYSGSTPPVNPPPFVNITNPTNSTVVSGTVPILVTATDATGIASVTISAPSTASCVLTVAPYTCSWDTTLLTNGGAYSVLVSATNNVSGITNTSANVTVDNGDTTPPVPGDSGNLIGRNILTTSFDLLWTRATDNITPQVSIEYAVYKSALNNIRTVAQAVANGTLVTGYTTNIATYHVTGLTHNSRYYFAVIAKDLAGNRAIYRSLQVRTRN